MTEFRYAERCLYDYPLNSEKLDKLREKLAELYLSSSVKAQGYEPIDHNGEPGNPVAARGLSLITLEARIERLERMTEPIKNLMEALDAPFVLDGTPLKDLAKVARMYYFAKMPKAEIAARLRVDKRTVYRMRERLVNLVIKYMGLRIESDKGCHTLDGNPCYTDTME